nr:alpha/beta hydrolase [Chromobacterium sp. ASV5]
MWDDDDVVLLTAPGWGDSGPRHWQSYWERLYPLSRRVEQRDWLNPQREAWAAGVARAVEEIDSPFVIAAHSLGCHAAVAWLLQASLRQQRQLKGLLLVAPPALPVAFPAARLGGASAPACSGFERAAAQRLPVPALLAASRNDPFCPQDEARRMAAGWGAEFIDAGDAGHMGDEDGLGNWVAGQSLLQRLILG